MAEEIPEEKRRLGRPPKKETAKEVVFNHDLPTEECRFEGRRFLKQQNLRWTWAEWNGNAVRPGGKGKGMWLPKPQLLGGTGEIEPADEKLYRELSAIRDTLIKMAEEITKAVNTAKELLL